MNRDISEIKRLNDRQLLDLLEQYNAERKKEQPLCTSIRFSGKSYRMLPKDNRVEIRPIGRGTYGSVYEVADDTSNPMVLKIIDPVMNAIEHYGYDVSENDIQASIANAQNEQSVAEWSHRSQCPALMPLSHGKVYVVGDCKNRPFFMMVMPKLMTLRDKIQSGLSVRFDAETHAKQLADDLYIALQTLSGSPTSPDSKQMGHHDIKPDNIFWNDGHWILGDFSLTSVQSESEIWHSSGRKSNCFAAPEKDVSSKSDLFGVGMVLYYVLSGQTSFERQYKTEKMDIHIYRHSKRNADKNKELKERVRRLWNASKDKFNRFFGTIGEHEFRTEKCSHLKNHLTNRWGASTTAIIDNKELQPSLLKNPKHSDFWKLILECLEPNPENRISLVEFGTKIRQMRPSDYWKSQLKVRAAAFVASSIFLITVLYTWPVWSPWLADILGQSRTMGFAEGIYEGQLTNGIRQGYGTFIWTETGTQFEGRWVDNQPCEGRFVLSTGETIPEDGTAGRFQYVENSFASNVGLIANSFGLEALTGKYTGYLFKGNAAGVGTIVSDDGSYCYRGELNGHPEGKGTLVYRDKDGTTYFEGVFHDGYYSHGKLINPFGVVVEGDFESEYLWNAQDNHALAHVEGAYTANTQDGTIKGTYNHGVLSKDEVYRRTFRVPAFWQNAITFADGSIYGFVESQFTGIVSGKDEAMKNSTYYSDSLGWAGTGTYNYSDGRSISGTDWEYMYEGYYHDFSSKGYELRYTGLLSQERPHGFGTIYKDCADSSLIYCGEFSDGKFDGCGYFSYDTTLEVDKEPQDTMDWYPEWIYPLDADSVGSNVSSKLGNEYQYAIAYYCGHFSNGLANGEGQACLYKLNAHNGIIGTYKITGKWENGSPVEVTISES